MFTGVGDTIVDRDAGADDAFIEFLCKPFPQGFPSILGVCSTETAELRQLVPGRAPDLDPFGALHRLRVERQHRRRRAHRTASNADGSQEVFLLNRRPQEKLTGVCLGGAAAVRLQRPRRVHAVQRQPSSAPAIPAPIRSCSTASASSSRSSATAVAAAERAASRGSAAAAKIHLLRVDRRPAGRQRRRLERDRELEPQGVREEPCRR